MIDKPFLLLEGGELLLEVDSIESIRVLNRSDYNDNGQLAGSSPYATNHDAGDFLTRIDMKSGRFHYAVTPVSEIIDLLQVLGRLGQ
jgi:hypothetical protein